MSEMPLKGKGVYTKEMRIANLAKARLARGKKGKSVKGKGITSQAETAVGTALGRGITSQAETAVGTASGKGYYTQDYVPSDQLNFLGNPLDNMDYAKIRSRKADKQKKGEYTYSKEMAVNDMPIPTVSGSGKKHRKTKFVENMKKHPNRTYEEEMVNDGYMPKMGVEVPMQYSRLMNGSGWNDFVRGVRGAEDVFSGVVYGLQTYDTLASYTPSSMPMGQYGRHETPNYNYTQTSGLYEPINQGWEMVGEPLSDRPYRSTSSIGSRTTIPSQPPLTDRPNKPYFKEDRSAMQSYNKVMAEDARLGKEIANLPKGREGYSRYTTSFDNLYGNQQQPQPPLTDRPNRTTIGTPERITPPQINRDIGYTDRPRRANEDRSAMRSYNKAQADADFRKAELNWQEAENTLQRGREAKRDTWYEPPYNEIIEANNRPQTINEKQRERLNEYDPYPYTDRPRRPNEDRSIYEQPYPYSDRPRRPNEDRSIYEQEMMADDARQARINKEDAEIYKRWAEQDKRKAEFLANEKKPKQKTGILVDFDKPSSPFRRETKQRANDLSNINLNRPYAKELREKAPSILKKKKKQISETESNRALDERLARASTNRFHNVDENIKRIQRQDAESAKSKVSASIKRKAETKRKQSEANALKKGRISEEHIFKEHLQEPKGTEQDVIKRLVGRPRKVKTEGEAHNERLEGRLQQTGLKKKNTKEPIKVVLKKNVNKPKY